MKEQYKIERKYQLKSYRNGLYPIPLYFFVLLIAYYIGETEQLFDTIFVSVITIYHGLLSIPALLIHLKYYKENKGLIVEIDKAQNEIVFNQNGEINKYNIDNLVLIEKKIHKDFRLKKWHQNWFPMPWNYYGFIRIETLDKKTFNLTSLMFDIEKPPLKENSIKYCIFSFFDKSLETIEKEKLERQEFQEREVKRFKEKYANYSSYQLKEIVEKDGIVIAAKTAAEELLNNTAANIGS